MRIAFMGTPDFAVPTLRRLLGSQHQIIAVVAQPSRRAGRGRRLQDPPTVTLAKEHGVPVFQPRAVRRGPFPERWESLGADVAVVVAYGRILTPRLLAAPRLGCINVHASLLPRYRGAAPIQWSVVRGEAVTGCTTILMDEGLDTGPILLQRSLPIGPQETAAELAGRLSQQGAELLLHTLQRLPALTPTPQDHSRHTLAPPLQKAHGQIAWSRSAHQIHCQVRGLTPWPGAFTHLRGDILRVHRARLVDPPTSEAAPGTIIHTRKKLLVATGDGTLELVQVQLPSKKRQDGAALICGARLQVGEVLQ